MAMKLEATQSAEAWSDGCGHGWSTWSFQLQTALYITICHWVGSTVAWNGSWESGTSSTVGPGAQTHIQQIFGLK